MLAVILLQHYIPLADVTIFGNNEVSLHELAYSVLTPIYTSKAVSNEANQIFFIERLPVKTYRTKEFCRFSNPAAKASRITLDCRLLAMF
jgi:hypothetical protein